MQASTLPDDILFYIFVLLHPREILRCSRVCSQWYRVAVDNALWKHIAFCCYPASAACANKERRSINWRHWLAEHNVIRFNGNATAPGLELRNNTTIAQYVSCNSRRSQPRTALALHFVPLSKDVPEKVQFEVLIRRKGLSNLAIGLAAPTIELVGVFLGWTSACNNISYVTSGLYLHNGQYINLQDELVRADEGDRIAFTIDVMHKAAMVSINGRKNAIIRGLPKQDLYPAVCLCEPGDEVELICQYLRE